MLECYKIKTNGGTLSVSVKLVIFIVNTYYYSKALINIFFKLFQELLCI